MKAFLEIPTTEFYAVAAILMTAVAAVAAISWLVVKRLVSTSAPLHANTIDDNLIKEAISQRANEATRNS